METEREASRRSARAGGSVVLPKSAEPENLIFFYGCPPGSEVLINTGMVKYVCTRLLNRCEKVTFTARIPGTLDDLRSIYSELEIVADVSLQ